MPVPLAVAVVIIALAVGGRGDVGSKYMEFRQLENRHIYIQKHTHKLQSFERQGQADGLVVQVGLAVKSADGFAFTK